MPKHFSENYFQKVYFQKWFYLSGNFHKTACDQTDP